MKSNTVSEPQRILIVKLSALGDVVMALPFLKALRARYPKAYISWLVEGPAAGIVDGHPDLDSVLIAPRKEISAFFKKRRIFKAVALVKEFAKILRQGDYDLVIDLQGLFKSAFWVYLTKAHRRVGFDKTREGAQLALNERLPAYDPNRHAVYRYLDVAVYLGAEFYDPKTTEYFPHYPGHAETAQKLLPGPGPWVALNPGAKWETKRWSLTHWRDLAEKLINQGVGVVITGGREDTLLGNFITEGLKGAINLCGQTDLKTLAELYRQTSLMITGDTGPMHLAAAVGAKVLAFFGPTYPERTGPLGPNVQVMDAGLDCLKCFKRQCPTQDCLKKITPSLVWPIVLNYL